MEKKTRGFFALVALLLAIAGLFHASEAWAEDPPMMEATAGYSIYGGPFARAWYLHETSFRILHIYAGGEIPLHNVGQSPADGDASARFRNGVPLANLTVGAAAHYGKGFFWLTAALFGGIADTQYGVTGGGMGVVDVRYLKVYGQFHVFAQGPALTAYAFGAVVRPYIQWVHLLYDCDSRDGGSGGGPKPCGLGLGLYFDLGATSAHVSVAGSLKFHDLAGNVASGKEELGGQVKAMLTIDL